MPGFTGTNGAARRCAQSLAPYLQFLGEQFDIPDEGAAET
jgi:hypothetical protein